jgi:membrane protease YdiL (CAAX protease family)
VDEFKELARWLITIGLVMLLILLRLEAEKFGTAEYYEATPTGERPRLRRRLTWYGLGFALVVAIIFVHPTPQQDLFLGSGDRIRAVVGGIAYGLLGVLVAVTFATYRYHRIRFPDSLSYPGALLNSVATAFIDEATFRGALFGLLLITGMNPSIANLIQAVVYAISTRLGAPRRDRYLLVLALGMGLIGGWLTAATGGIAAAFLGHAITRFAVFLCTGHTGQTKPRGREV